MVIGVKLNKVFSFLIILILFPVIFNSYSAYGQLNAIKFVRILCQTAYK